MPGQSPVASPQVPRYTYQRPLPDDHIRVLTLVSDGMNFQGSLEEFPDDNLPYFSALSWCWPSREAGQITEFECDNRPFQVPRSLYNLLSNLNPKDAPSSMRIWIDFICINQDNLTEKNFHVAHMHKIYGQAQQVIIWLGMPNGGSDMVMNSQRVSDLNAALQLLPSSHVSQSETAPGLPPSDDPIWRATGRLCDRDWFYRTWVVQEIALARSAELLCGTQWLAWDEFVNLVQNISRVGLASICRGPRSTETSRADGFSVLMDLSWTRTMVQNNDMSMSYLLHMVRSKEVTKPVDKVYGLLGIIGDDLRSAIQVNYAENDRQYWKAYVELAEQMLTRDNGAFWLLCMASSQERPDELPTWCPNFNSLTPEYLDFGNQQWRAGVGNNSPERSAVHLIRNSSSIKIRGFRIDVVDEVVQLGGPYSATIGAEARGRDGNIAAFLERDGQCLELTLRLFDEVHNAWDAYTRTLIANCWINGSPIDGSQADQVRNAYEDCKKYLTGTSTTHMTDDNRTKLAQQYITQLGWWQERPFYTTTNGRIGRGAFNMQAGDAICVFYQAGPVFVLRYVQERGEWNLVGDAYLHGCMDLDNMPVAGREVDTDFTIS